MDRTAADRLTRSTKRMDGVPRSSPSTRPARMLPC